MIMQGHALMGELGRDLLGRYWVHMIVPTDREYYIPELEDVIVEARAISMAMTERGLTYTEEVGDCDDFAFVMLSDMREQAWLDLDRRRPWPVGMALLTEPFGHALNVVRCREGWYEIEPQTGELTSFEASNYSGFFLWIF